jgi:hypothetical protein
MTTIGSIAAAPVQTPPVPQAAVAAKPQATAGSEYALFKTPEDMVEFAENTLDKLNRSLGYAEGLRRSLTPELFEENRKTFGEEGAKQLQALLEEAKGKFERMAKTDEAALRGAFSIKGDLITRDKDGMRTLGRFTLSGGGPGFAVLIDSEKGASISKNGGAFTSDFARITPPQSRNLPYLQVIADSLNVKV